MKAGLHRKRISWSWLSELGRSGAVMQALFICTSEGLHVFSFTMRRMTGTGYWPETARLAMSKWICSQHSYNNVYILFDLSATCIVHHSSGRTLWQVNETISCTNAAVARAAFTPFRDPDGHPQAPAVTPLLRLSHALSCADWILLVRGILPPDSAQQAPRFRYGFK